MRTRTMAGLRQLTRPDWYCLLWACGALIHVSLLLRLQGLEAGRRWAQVALPARAQADQSTMEAMRWARLINAVANRAIPGSSCLPRSLALIRFMRRRGFAAELRLGAPKEALAETFSAHAWVEYAGMVINDQPDVAARHAVFELPALGGAR